MKYIFLLILALYSHTTINASEIDQPYKHEWIKCAPSERFVQITNLSPQLIYRYQEKVVPYFNARGVSDKQRIENYVHDDFLHIASALNILFEQDSTEILNQFLGQQFSMIKGYKAHIDHVGRELYGPISFYLPLMKQLAPELGLIHLRDVVFPSTQVVETLRKHDPNLQGVTIARIYFQNISNGKIRSLELFQTAPLNESCPQKIKTTEERFSLLTAPNSNSFLTPIDHLSIELNSLEEVQNIHNRINLLRSKNLTPCNEKISYNAGDKSSQVKVLLRDSETTAFNKIVEFVYYEK
ncbi:MAG: hypothetical protein S4CHLAM20_11270 [Chlamydiia bacterium]|nr:hypothetical protein [Chlamydiia bacterium]